MTYFKKFNDGDEKKQAKKKRSWKKNILSLEKNLFFSECFFYLPKLTVFFRNPQQSKARAGQKKTHVFFGNARPKSKARAHLKRGKKHSGLTAGCRPRFQTCCSLIKGTGPG